MIFWSHQAIAHRSQMNQRPASLGGAFFWLPQFQGGAMIGSFKGPTK
jgi:hypothetical protein